MLSGSYPPRFCTWSSALPDSYWQSFYNVNIFMYADEWWHHLTARKLPCRDYTCYKMTSQPFAIMGLKIILVLNLTKCCYIVFTRKPLLTMSMYHILMLVTFTPLATLSPYVNTLIYFNIHSPLVPSYHKWKPEKKQTTNSCLYK